MRYGTVILLFAVVMASGCAYSNAGDADDLSQLADKADTSNYRVGYSFDMEGSALIGEISSDAELFSYNGETRFERSTIYPEGNTTTSIYSMNGSEPVRCKKSSIAANDTVEIECNRTEATAERYIDGSMYTKDSYSVNYVEDREYAGRECSFYSIGLPPSHFENSSVINTGAFVDLCLDKEKGYVAYNSMNLSAPINSAGKQISNIYTIEAKNYSSDVTGEDVNPPDFESEDRNLTEN